MTKYIQKQKKQEAKRSKIVYDHLRELYSFAKYLNTDFLKNRRERKSFWIKVSRGEALLETTMERLIEHHKPTPKVKAVRQKPIMPTLPKKGKKVRSIESGASKESPVNSKAENPFVKGKK